MTLLDSSSRDLEKALMGEIVEWLVLLNSGEATEQDHDALRRWRAKSPTHEAAWLLAEKKLQAFTQLPSDLGSQALARLSQIRRRQFLRHAMVALAIPGSAWLAWQNTPWREWAADLHTATGEQRTINLADGTRLILNTASSVNVAFSAHERRIVLLTGEILITTGSDPSHIPRPFFIETAQGLLRPLGTRFTVRNLGESTRVSVSEGAVEVRPHNATRRAVVNAGEQLTFTAELIQAVQPADSSSTLWEGGMLLAKEMRLGELVKELSRYHRGVLRCDPSVTNLKVSGAFSLRDIPASMRLLEQTLPVKISSVTSYWVTVQAL